MPSSSTRVSAILAVLPRKLEALVAQAAAGQRLAPLLDSGHHLWGLAWVDRPHEPVVDRCHRRHVARPQALETADVHVLEVATRLLQRLEQRLRIAQLAGHAGAYVHLMAAERLGVEHV